MPSKYRIPVIQVSVEDEIKRLERQVARYERRYELDSDVMLEDVRCGRMRATIDVEEWMIVFRDLQRLRDALDRATGATTTITEQPRHAK